MTLLAPPEALTDTSRERLPEIQLEPAAAGRAVLYALDGTMIDLDGLRCGQQLIGHIQIDDRQHTVRLTEALRAAEDGATHTVAILHGFTEMVERGTGKNLHDAISREFPYSRVASIATDGVGAHCNPLSLKKSWELTFKTMAQDRLHIMSAMATDGPVTEVGISMGSVIGLVANRLNQQQHLVDIDQIINHSHAQVKLSHVPVDMLMRFPLHMLKDGTTEAMKHPAEAADSLLGFLAIAGGRAACYVGNVKNLARGTRLRTMYASAKEVPTSYIIGEHDPLAQRKTLRKLQAALPDTVQVLELPAKGHACSLDADKAAKDIATVWAAQTITSLVTNPRL